MDPFSITIAVIGISGTAVNGLSRLHKTISAISDAPDEINGVRQHLDSIKQALGALASPQMVEYLSDSTAGQALATTGLTDAVNDCGTACEKFEKRLQKWTRHSTEDKLSVLDKMSVGVWNKEWIRTFKTRLETCQQTVHFVVSSTQL